MIILLLQIWKFRIYRQKTNEYIDQFYSNSTCTYLGVFLNSSLLLKIVMLWRIVLKYKITVDDSNKLNSAILLITVFFTLMEDLPQFAFQMFFYTREGTCPEIMIFLNWKLNKALMCHHNKWYQIQNMSHELHRHSLVSYI